MKDIVERLRQGSYLATYYNEEMRLAADEIERLRSELQKSEAQIEIERLRTELRLLRRDDE